MLFMIPSQVQKWYDADYRITACGARNSTIYYIMTRGAKGYAGKKQTCITKDSWHEAQEFISLQWKDGKILTGICYSTGKKQYLLVMTESSERQTYKLQTTSQATDNDWMNEEFQEGHYPTIIFHDPSDSVVIVVVTSDSNRSGYIERSKHGLIK